MKKILYISLLLLCVISGCGSKGKQESAVTETVDSNGPIGENQEYLVFFLNDEENLYEDFSAVFTRDKQNVEVALTRIGNDYYAVVAEPGDYSVTMHASGYYRPTEVYLPLQDTEKTYLVPIDLDEKGMFDDVFAFFWSIIKAFWDFFYQIFREMFAFFLPFLN